MTVLKVKGKLRSEDSGEEVVGRTEVGGKEGGRGAGGQGGLGGAAALDQLRGGLSLVYSPK